MYFTMYLDNVVKGLGKTTGGMLVLFTVYPLFVIYDSYLHSNTKKKLPTVTPPPTPSEQYSKIDDFELQMKIKASLDQLI